MSYKNPQDSVAANWANTFGLPWNKENPDVHHVQLKLNALREEVDLLEIQMKATNYSVDLFSPYLGNVRRVVSASNLDMPWQQIRSLLGPDTLLSLKWCAESLAREPEIVKEDLENVLQKIVELRAEVELLGLSVVVRDFILRQLTIIEKAIQDYPIKGGAAIRRGLHDVFTTYTSAEGEPKTEEEKSEVSKLNQVVAFFGKVADGVIKTDKVSKAAISIANSGHTAISSASQFLANFPQIPL
jgi:hypothetical protein